MNYKTIIINTLIIAAIFGGVTLSQKADFGNNVYSGSNKVGSSDLGKYTAKFGELMGITGGWIKSLTYNKLSGEVGRELEKRQEIIKEEIEKQKEIATESAFYVSKKFVAKKILNTLGVKPEDLLPNNLICQTK